MIHLGIVIMGLCTFLALMVALFQTTTMSAGKVSQRLDTAIESKLEPLTFGTFGYGAMNKLSEQFIASLGITLRVVAWLLGLWLLLD
jgi:hypothetical protein